MQLVDDDELEAREQLSPPGVVRQHTRVQHVGIGHHDVAGLLDRGAAPWWGVTVIGVDPQVDGKAALQRSKLRQLVLRESFGGKQVDRPALWVLEQALKYREVVAEGLAARCRGDHDQVAAGPYRGVSLGLVGVQALDSAGPQRGGQLRLQVRGKRSEYRLGGRQQVVEGDLALEVGGVERRERGHSGELEVNRTCVRGQARSRRKFCEYF